ncbi:putative MFS transporter Fmp42 [Aspergillus saccharolyticus JOP 1030-1]|uniref:MFS general substrate transporter n=1 Tax=Aspergillus saccharolyticus JOP 1030-1 TaxID=1450539 RepID=A0A319A9C2_9EURO|nr:MFS general substrate transporter [Aspergillus saccharolyticus JOP 1030-1]PYH43612.1 MFS general substrate transporter [Aspergillus saccharolyticus JOP 1030-1]
MSLNRVSYLESWEQNPAAFRRQPHQDDSEDEESYHDLPEPSLSSSFQSNISRHSFRHRLNFNPYAGPAWGQATVDEDTSERNPPLQVASPKIGTLNEADREDPVPAPLAPKLQEWTGGRETTGAFEVSRAKRIAQVCIAVVYCLLAAGIVFGFAAIKPVLIREGVYRDRCSQAELDNNSDVCYGQELRLNLMFTIAAVATNVFALPVGTILDTYGPRVCGIIGSISLILGSLLFGLSHKLPFDGYMPGYLFLSLGGPFVFISSFHLSNTFPTRSGLILSTLTGAFDASSALFLVFRLFNESTHGSFSSTRFFLLYLIVPVFIMTAELTIMPTASYKTAGELVQEAQAHIAAEARDHVDDAIQDRHEGERQRNDRRVHRQNVVSQIQDLLASPELQPHSYSDDVPTLERPINTATITTDSTVNPHSDKPHTAGGVWGALHGASALTQIRTPWFVLITLFTILQMLRINYFVATIRQQYTYLLHSPDLAATLNSTFDVLLPLGGLLSVPFIGTILDSTRTPSVLLTLVTAATIIGVLGCIPTLEAGYGNIALFVLYRPFYYTAVSDYAAKVFGFQTFGKVYGLIICLAGLGNFAQAGLDALTFTVFHRDPTPVNAVLTGTTFLVGVALVAFVSWQARRMAAASHAKIIDATTATSPGPANRPVEVVESGLSVPGLHDGVDTRDWGHRHHRQSAREGEREPLLRQGTDTSPSYGGTRP